jgi:hypothetical protein
VRPEPSFARSVVAWGNACLRGSLAFDAFDAYWPSTAFIRTLRFRDGARVISPSAAWFRSLRERYTGDLRLMLDATGSSERIVVCTTAPVSAWQQQWDRIAGAQQAPWFDAVFVAGPAPARKPVEGPAVHQVLASLTTALDGLVALSKRAELAQWGGYFAHVLDVAHGGDSPGFSTRLPPTAAPEAHTLARAAGLADVFGGMGSWNDFAPLPDAAAEDERSRWSDQLYRSVQDALVATSHAG